MDHPKKKGTKVLDCIGRPVRVRNLVDLSYMSLPDRFSLAGELVNGVKVEELRNLQNNDIMMKRNNRIVPLASIPTASCILMYLYFNISVVQV